MPDMIDLATAGSTTIASNSLAPKNSDYSDIFGNFATNLYTNFTKIFQTDVNFFVMVPASLLPYYYYIVLQQLYWYRGFVPGVHNNGIVSQQLGGWICDTVANLVASGGFHIEVEDDILEDALVNMLKKRKIQSKLTKRLSMLNAGGFMLAFATHLYGTDTKDVDNYNITFIDCNRHFAKVNAEGEVKGFVAYIKAMTPNPTKTEEDAYYLVLKRWVEIIDNVEYCLERYCVFMGPSLITTPTFESFDNKGKELEQIPESVSTYFRHHVGDVKINETILTPFVDSCGAVIIHNTPSASGVEEYGNFANGTLFTIINQLYEYDITIAQKMVNKFMSITKVLLPDNFYSPPIPNNGGSNDPDRYAAQVAGYHNSFNAQLGHQIFKKVPYVSAKEQSPFFFQAKNESDVYNSDVKFMLSAIASKIHISPSTLAPFISEKAGLNQKTAKEVSSEESETRTTIHTKRELISDALESLLTQISIAVGQESYEIQVIFNNEEVSNPIQELEIIGKRLELGLTSKIRALKRANRHLSKRELTSLQSEIQSDLDEVQERELELKEKAEPVETPKPTE